MSSQSNPKQQKMTKPSVHHGEGYPGFIVRKDLTPGNGRHDYDTLLSYGLDVAKRAPAGTVLPAIGKAHQVTLTGNAYNRAQQIGLWLAEFNELKKIRSKDCKGNGLELYLMYPGDEICSPKGLPILEPKQVASPCDQKRSADCVVKKKEPEPVIVATPAPIIPEAVEQEKPKEAEKWLPHYYARNSTQATYGPTYYPGSMDHALQTLARTGLDENFTWNYYKLPNVTPRLALTKAEQSGEVGGNLGAATGDHLLEGKRFSGENSQSRMDDDYAKKRKGTTGHFQINNPRGRDYIPGHIEVNSDGSYQRSGEFITAPIHGGDYASTWFPFNSVVNHGKLGGMPVGIGTGRPKNQEPFEAETRRWGLSQVNIAMAQVNIGGKHNMFADQRTYLSSPGEATNRIYGYTYMLNAQKTFSEAMRAVESATTPEEKETKARLALTAYRDFSTNFLVKNVDSMAEPTRISGEAIRTYLRDVQKVDVAKIDAELPGIPQLDLVDMSNEQKESQYDWNVAKKRFTSLEEGKTNAALQASKKFVYLTMNDVEARIARNDATRLDEAGVISNARDAWKTINYKADGSTVDEAAIKRFGDFVATDTSAAIEMGQTLRDIWQHNEFYTRDGKKLTNKEAKDLVKSFIGDNKEVLDDITRSGNTTPIPFAPDQALPIARPDLIGPAVGAKIKENPEAFAKLMDMVTGDERGKKSDGRRFGTALLHTIGAERPTSGEDGVQAPAIKDILATKKTDQDKEGELNPVQKKLHDQITNATLYAEEGAAGRSVLGANHIDNTITQAQKNAKAGIPVDLNQTYAEAYSSPKAKELGSDQVIIQALKNHPGLARDVYLASVLNNPEELKAAEDGLRSLKRSQKSKLQDYDGLYSVIKDTRRAAEEYKRTGNAEDMNKAVEKFGRFFTVLEENAGAKRDRVQNKAQQSMTAWNGLMQTIGNDEGMSAAMVQTMSRHTSFRDALLKSGQDAVYADSMRHSTTPKYSVPNTSGDDVYQSVFFTLPVNEKTGKVDANKGFLGLTKNQVTVNTEVIQKVLAGNTTAKDIANAQAKAANAAPLFSENKADTSVANNQPATQETAAATQTAYPANSKLITFKNGSTAKLIMNTDGETVDWAATEAANKGNSKAKNKALGRQVQLDAFGAGTVDWTKTEMVFNKNGATLSDANNAPVTNLAPAANNAPNQNAAPNQTANQQPVSNNEAAGPINQNSLPANVQQQLAELKLQGVTNGISENNALRTNPVLYLGSSTNQDGTPVNQQAALANWLTTKINEHPQLKNDQKVNNPEAINKAAEQLIANNLVKISNNPDELVATANMEAVQQNLATFPNMNMGMGFDRRILLLFLPIPKHITKIVEVPCVGCQPIPTTPTIPSNPIPSNPVPTGRLF